MAKKRVVPIELEFSTHINQNDIKDIVGSIEKLSNLALLNDNDNERLAKMKSDFAEITKMLDPKSDQFVDQASVKNADLVYNKVKELGLQLQAFKEHKLGHMIFEADTSKLDKDIERIESMLEGVKKKAQESLGLSDGEFSDIMGGKGITTKKGRASVKTREFEGTLGIDQGGLAAILSDTRKDASIDTLISKLGEIREKLLEVNEAGEKLHNVKDFLKTDESAATYEEDLKSLIHALENYDELATNLNVGTHTKIALQDKINAGLEQEGESYEELTKLLAKYSEERQKIIDDALDEQKQKEELLKLDELMAAELKKQAQLTAAAKAEEEKLEQARADQVTQVDNLIKRYTSFTAVLALLKRALTEAYRTLSSLDEAFTEMAIVTAYTNQQIWGMYDSFKDIAKITGFTSAEIASVTAEYLKQGETLRDSLVLTEAAAKAAQVAGITTEESVRYLTSAVRGYRIAAEDAMLVSDKFAAVAAATATDYDGMATAISKVAAQAYANNVEMDNLMGILATAMDVTQEAPENIGTAFKTIFARMTQISDYGKVLEDGVDINKVETALKLANVSLMDVEGNFRNLDDVLMEVGANWQRLNSTQKAYITNTLAGTRQQTRLLAVFENYDKLLKNIETSQDSAGATNAQQAKYMESLAAATNEVAVAWASLITSITDTEVFKAALGVIADLLTSTSDFFKTSTGQFTKIMALVGGVSLGVSGLISAFSMLGSYSKTKWTEAATSLSEFRTGIRKVTNAVGETQAVTLSFGGKAVSSINMVKTAFVGLSTAIFAITAVFTIVSTLFNYFSEKERKRIEAINEEITKLEGNLYSLREEKKSIEGLVEEYDKLEKSIYKTNEELDRMKQLAEAISDFDLDNVYRILNEDGSLNRRELERMQKENEKTERENLEKQIELNREALDFDDRSPETIAKITEVMIYDAFGGVEGLEEIPNQLKGAINNLVKASADYVEEIVIDPSTLTWGEKVPMLQEFKLVDNDTDNGLATFEVPLSNPEYLLKKIKELKDPLTEIFELIGRSDSLTGRGFATALNKILGPLSEFDTDLIQKIVPSLEEFADFANSGLSMSKIEEYAAMLRIVTDLLGKELPADMKENLVEAFDKGYGEFSSFLIDNFEEIGLSGYEVLEVLQKINLELHDTSFDGMFAGFENLEKWADNIENINSALEDNDWGANNLKNLYALISEYPEHAESMIKAIEEGEAIDAASKTAMLEGSRSKLKEELRLKLFELQNQIELEKARLGVLEAVRGDDLLMAELLSKGLVTLDNFQVENLFNGLEQGSTKTAAVLSDRLRMYHEAQSKIAQWVRDAEQGISPDGYSKVLANSAYGKAPSKSTLPNVSRPGGIEIMADVFGEGDAIGQVTQKELQQFKALLDSQIDMTKSTIQSIQNQIDFTEIAIQKVENMDLAQLGKSDDRDSTKTGKKSDASEKAEYYLGALNKLYVAEQRVKAAELFFDKNNSLRDYAASIEALGDSYEGLDDKFTSSAKLLEDQYALYGVMAEEQEHMVDVLTEYQASLVAGLNPALLKTFKVIDGRIIPVSEEYGKLNAENMEILDQFAEKFNDYADSIDEATQASIEYKVAQNELLADMRDAVIEWQEVMIEAIKNEEKKYLDSFKKLIDANKDYLNERKKLYQDSFSAEDTDSELAKIEEERLTLTEKIAALEGAHDLNSLKRKEDYRKQLQDLNNKYTELTLQYNRDAYLQRIDDQIAYQDEVYQKEEEAYNERVSDAQWLEDRIAEITRDARIQALIDQGIHNMTLDELIDAGYISHEQATAAGLKGVEGTVSEWSDDEKEALADHFADNTEQFEGAWGDKTAEGEPGAEGIVKAAIDNIIKYLEQNHPIITDATSVMKDAIVADWNAMTAAAAEYTENFDGITLGAPDFTELTDGLNATIEAIKKAADDAEREYERLKASQDKASSGTVGSPSGTPKTPDKTNTPKEAPTVRHYNYLKNGIVYEWVDIKNGQIVKYGPKKPVSNSSAIAGQSGVNVRMNGSQVVQWDSKMATGGTTERTGFHWLDGSPGKPERVLSAGQDKEFQELLGKLTTEAKLRTDSYVSLSSLEQIKDLTDSLYNVAAMVVKSDEHSTDEIVNEIRRITEVVQNTSSIRPNALNGLVSTITSNKKG